eukprot:274396-Pleurochrysis_carterae.AAC.1
MARLLHTHGNGILICRYLHLAPLTSPHLVFSHAAFCPSVLFGIQCSKNHMATHAGRPSLDSA